MKNSPSYHYSKVCDRIRFLFSLPFCMPLLLATSHEHACTKCTKCATSDAQVAGCLGLHQLLLDTSVIPARTTIHKTVSKENDIHPVSVVDRTHPSAYE